MAGLVRAAVIIGTIAWFSPLHGGKPEVTASLATTGAQMPSMLAVASGLAEKRDALPPEARAALDRLVADAALAAVRQSVPRP